MIQRNPFFKIPFWLKAMVALYFIYFVVVLNLMQLLTESDLQLEGWLLIGFRIINGFLIVLPALYFRKVGVLHLLVFPFLLSLTKQIVQNPSLFIEPLQGGGIFLESTVAYNLNHDSLLTLNLEQELYTFLGSSFLLLGFVITKTSGIEIYNNRVIPKQSRFIWLATILIVISIGFFVSQGGLTNWIIQWGAQGGRRNAMEGLGPILKLLKVSFIVPLSWYVFYGKRVYKNPLFWTLVFFTVFLGFFSTGSRSSVLHGVIPFFIVYIIRNNTIPVGRIALFGSFFFILFGLFGQIRTSSTYTGGNFSWDNIDYELNENIDNAVEEADKWGSLGADVATYHYISETGQYLYGKSYVAVIAFWIPRALWPGKPHGVGYYTGRDIFRGHSGVPPSEVAEAFWNFNLFGILLISFLHGVAIKFISDIYMNNSRHKGVLVLYVIILSTGFSIASLGLTRLVQTLFYAVLTLKYLRSI